MKNYTKAGVGSNLFGLYNRFMKYANTMTAHMCSLKEDLIILSNLVVNFDSHMLPNSYVFAVVSNT